MCYVCCGKCIFSCPSLLFGRFLSIGESCLLAQKVPKWHNLPLALYFGEEPILEHLTDEPPWPGVTIIILISVNENYPYDHNLIILKIWIERYLILRCTSSSPCPRPSGSLCWSPRWQSRRQTGVLIWRWPLKQTGTVFLISDAKFVFISLTLGVEEHIRGQCLQHIQQHRSPTWVKYNIGFTHHDTKTVISSWSSFCMSIEYQGI